MSNRTATAGSPSSASPSLATIETRTSWVIATVALLLLSFTYGAPLIVVVALKPIAATLDVPRAIPSLAAALVWFGTGSGGIAMGLFADRIGVRWVVLGGTLMMGVGLRCPASAPPGRCCSATGCSSACWAAPASIRRCWSMSAAGSTSGAAPRWH